jgi:hypothetical protein
MFGECLGLSLQYTCPLCITPKTNVVGALQMFDAPLNGLAKPLSRAMRTLLYSAGSEWVTMSQDLEVGENQRS